jgi:uncharacterized protein
VLKAREPYLAGATVLQGITGFGADSRMHTAKLLRAPEDLPIVIELVDTVEGIDVALPSCKGMLFLDECVDEGLITLETARVIRYRHKNGA